MLTCIPPTLPKKKLVGGKVLDEHLLCLVHVIWEPYLPSLCFFLPKPCQVWCSRVSSSHASSCPWPTASCKILIAQKWGHCPLHFIFYLPFPLKLSKTTKNHLVLGSAHTEVVLLIAVAYSRDTFVSAGAGRKWGERREERKWWWRAANPDTESLSAFLSLLYHKNTCFGKAKLSQGTTSCRPSPKCK